MHGQRVGCLLCKTVGIPFLLCRFWTRACFLLFCLPSPCILATAVYIFQYFSLVSGGHLQEEVNYMNKIFTAVGTSLLRLLPLSFITYLNV